MKLTLFRTVTVLLTAALMCFIFSMSGENAETSSETSGSVIKSVLSFFYRDFEKLTAEEQTEIVSSYQFAARKTAHFSVYTLLGILVLLSFITYNSLSVSVRRLLSAAVCLCYAAGDELHQYFVPGRSCELRDIAIDFTGSLAGIAVCSLVYGFAVKRRTGRKSDEPRGKRA